MIEFQDNQKIHEQVSQRYSYSRQSPLVRRQNYEVYEGVHRDLNVEVTLKIWANVPQEVLFYLKKMKGCKAEGIIKFYELFESSAGMFIATERAAYGSLKTALGICRKLDDFDFVFVSKLLLNVQAEMLRAGFQWFGSEQDIQFTEAGIRLSWNNSVPLQGENCFPLILSRMAGKLQLQQQRILPVAKSKAIQELIKVSGGNASEISSNGFVKKKQKVLRRKGKGWLGLKEYKNDFEYYQEVVIFAIHQQHGFVRVKVYPTGTVKKQVLALNQEKNTFTRVVDFYSQGGKTHMVSLYSNDGSLYNYVNKLKATGIALTQQQIQFFFYSLLQPLKIIQESSIRSLNMVHIKNIYIQNGIPKLGEPVPINSELQKQLKQKSQVPDFYHPQFKMNPQSHDGTYDTYSLGVLTYKLMFTQYPIFPQKNKVHIPSTPAYNKRLKTTLQILLDEGGLLVDLEKKIEVSQKVAQEVGLNKKKLMKQKQKTKSQKGRLEQDYQKLAVVQIDKEVTSGRHLIEGEEQEQLPEGDCCRICRAQLVDPVKHRSVMLDSLQQSPYACYRLCFKIILILCLYVCLMYIPFLQGTVKILQNYKNYNRMNVTITTVNYQITVSSSKQFFTNFNVTDRSLTSLKNMGCFINSGVDYTSRAQSNDYFIYVVFGLVTLGLILLIKIVQVAKFDFNCTVYNMSNLRTNFNLSNYIIIHLFVCGLINNHYIFFQQLFQTTVPTCLGVVASYDFGSTYIFYTDNQNFIIVFVTTFVIHFVVAFLHLLMILKTYSIRYTRIFNPILIFTPLIVGYIVVVRIGVVSQYYPSLLREGGVYAAFFKNIDYVAIISLVPQILFLFEFIIEMLVDWIFWFIFDKSRRMLIHDLSSAGIAV